MLNDFLWLKIFKDGIVLLIFNTYLLLVVGAAQLQNLPHSLPRSFAGNTQWRRVALCGWKLSEDKRRHNTLLFSVPAYYLRLLANQSHIFTELPVPHFIL